MLWRYVSRLSKTVCIGVDHWILHGNMEIYIHIWDISISILYSCWNVKKFQLISFVVCNAIVCRCHLFCPFKFSLEWKKNQLIATDWLKFILKRILNLILTINFKLNFWMYRWIKVQMNIAKKRLSKIVEWNIQTGEVFCIIFFAFYKSEHPLNIWNHYQ